MSRWSNYCCVRRSDRARRPKPEIRIENMTDITEPVRTSAFGFRTSFGLRPSDFGLPIALLANRTSCPYVGAAKFKQAMKRRVIYGILTVALAVNLLIGARIFLNSAQAAEKDSVYPSMELFAYVMERVRKDYVDGQKLTYQELVYGALKGMLSTLDPHSEFMEPEKYKELQSETQGVFGGLGIVISMKDNFITVVAPMEDSPGFRAGILSGDRILKIEGRSTEKMGLPDAVKNLRGEPGTEVTMTVYRPSSNQMRDYKLTRSVINIDMVKDIHGKKDFPLGENKIGYVRLVQFGEKTSDDLEAALKKLRGQGMQARSEERRVG